MVNVSRMGRPTVMAGDIRREPASASSSSGRESDNRQTAVAWLLLMHGNLLYPCWMDVDVAETAASAMPYVTAAVAAYGISTLDKVRNAVIDGASDVTVSIGHQVLNRLLRREQSRQVIEGAVTDIAAGEEGSAVALQLQIRKAMTADPGLTHEIARMLPQRNSQRYVIQRQSNSGSGNIINGNNYGSISPASGTVL
ncbi:hypothetical protein ABZ403_12660 [Micromonospora zamorensis]|uniref:hypothetical protein n=1 Tax=Micromonospora TaxID=1873 RepID=UPI0033B81E83